MTKEDPLVSIIIPTHNRPDLLKKAVRSAAQQNYKNIEIVVVNDGLPVGKIDGREVNIEQVARESAEGRPFRFFYDGKNRKLSGARNEGLRIATGDVIAYCDDDDVLLPNHVRLAVNTMKEHDADATFSQACSVYHQDGAPDKRMVLHNFPFSPTILAATNLWPPVSLTHKNLHMPIWDTSVPLLEDLDAYQRMHWQLGLRFADVKAVTCEYHHFENKVSMTNVGSKAFADAYRQIWPRWKPYWQNVPDAGLIQKLQSEAMGFQNGDAPETKTGDPATSYERFITRLYQNNLGATSPQQATTADMSLTLTPVTI